MRVFSQTTDQRVFLMASINLGEYFEYKGFYGAHSGPSSCFREIVAAVADVLEVGYDEFDRLVEAYAKDPSQYHPSGLTPAEERSAESVAQLLVFIRTFGDSDRLFTEVKSTVVVNLNTGESVTVVASF